MAAVRFTRPRGEGLRNHWDWRPEWRSDRPCLYWYLTFDEETIAEAIGADVLDRAAAVPWLDAVPPRWLHVTLCDIGFADEVAPHVVGRAVREARRVTAATGPLRLRFGPLTAMAGAVVLPAGPVSPLRALQRRVRWATRRALGPECRSAHRQFWPHLSLGYVNRAVPRSEAERRLPGLSLARVAEAPVTRLTLASVTRRNRHYQWSVEAEVPLVGQPSPSLADR